MLKKRIKFEHLPWVIRQTLVTILGWYWSRLRYGSLFDYESRLLQRTRDISPKTRERLQRYRLARLLEKARNSTCLYSKTVPPISHSAINSLRNTPVLEKEQIKQNPDQVKNEGAEKGRRTSTSGTSGQPLVVEHSPESDQIRWAYLADHKRLCGVAHKARSIRLSGRVIANPARDQRKPWVYVPSEHQLLLSTYHINGRHCHIIADKINAFRPTVLDGYPSAILSLLRLVDGKVPWDQFLELCIATAETLTPEVKKEIEALTDAPVVDYYAASEGVPLIQQCLHGTYHVRWQSGYFEVDTSAGIANEGTGELIATSFTQDRMPLIRYRTGDFVENLTNGAAQRCPCGEVGPTIDKIIGRVEELVTIANGESMGMFSYRTLKEFYDIKQAQIIQDDIEHFRVRLVASGSADLRKTKREIEKKFEQVLGYKVAVQLEPVDEIPKGPNGKMQLVINNIGRNDGNQNDGRARPSR